MSNGTVITGLKNIQKIEAEFVYQKYYESDLHKWGHDLGHFSRAKESIKLYKWVEGIISFNELLDVELTQAQWAKVLTKDQPHTLRYALECLHQKISTPPTDFLPDFKILNDIIASLKNNSFNEDENFVIIRENTVYDGNHRIITIPFVRGVNTSTRCYFAC